MKPFHLDIARAPDDGFTVRWFGTSALRPAGTMTLPRAPAANETALPDRFAIDLVPLLAEVGAAVIPNADALAMADDLLPLRELLSDVDYTALCETLFLFLWRTEAPPLAFTKEAIEGRAWADPDRRLVRVWFATNRARSVGDGGEGAGLFSDTASAEGLSFGRCSVFIPESHKPGSVGSPWWRRWIRLDADDRLEVRTAMPLPEAVFWGRLAECLAREWNRGERNLFVLIHGFNVSFTDAALRAAQIGYDLKLPGEMAFYSWPSRGAVLDYMADEATITASVESLADFLEGLGTRAGAERIHLFVHSMGNRGFLSALERLATRSLPPLRLGQVFFCAPDEDVRTFADKTRLFPQVCENRTLLVSPDDRAVALAKWIHKFDRVGIVPPVHAYDGIETIAVNGFGLLDLGHGYFAEAEPVILDLRDAIESRRRAGERGHPRSPDGHYLIDLER